MLGNILAFDPGDTTGVCEFNERGQVLRLFQLSFDDLLKFLNDYPGPVMQVVCEDFILFRKKARQQSGSKMKASQAIGMIKAFALRKEAPLAMQGSDIKPMAMKFSQIKMPSNHSESHQYDAFLHGYYWLVKNGMIKTRLQEQISG